MTTTVSASDEPALVLVSENGAPGDDGDPGQNGTGLNDIRYSALNNPLLNIFKKNNLVEIIAPSNEDSDLTVLASTTQTYIDQYLFLRNSPINTIRQSYKGWVLEGESTNKFIQSEFASGWSGNSSITLAAEDGPDGVTNSAVKFVESSSDEPQTIQQIVSATASTPLTASVFAKPDDNNFINITFSIAHISTGANIYFDLTNGTVTSQSNIDSFEAEKLNNGWYRCSATITPDASAAGAVQFRNSRNGTTSSYLGNGVRGVFAYGAQVEELNSKSSYIRSTNSPATRTGIMVSSQAYNNIPNLSEPYTFYFNYISYVTGITQNIISIETSGGGVFEGIFVSSSGLVRSRNGDTLVSSSTNVNDGLLHSIAVKYDGSNLCVYVDGVMEEQLPLINPEKIINPGVVGYGSNYSSISSSSYCFVSDLRAYDYSLSDQEISFLSEE